jgi:hypothetical protein
VCGRLWGRPNNSPAKRDGACCGFVAVSTCGPPTTWRPSAHEADTPQPPGERAEAGLESPAAVIAGIGSAACHRKASSTAAAAVVAEGHNGFQYVTRTDRRLPLPHPPISPPPMCSPPSLLTYSCPRICYQRYAEINDIVLLAVATVTRRSVPVSALYGGFVSSSADNSDVSICMYVCMSAVQSIISTDRSHNR